MLMDPGLKSRGRPSNKSGGAPTFNKTKRKRHMDIVEEGTETSKRVAVEVAVPKKRGRPQGSKNKPNITAIEGHI